jgi:hypothetical protein
VKLWCLEEPELNRKITPLRIRRADRDDRGAVSAESIEALPRRTTMRASPSRKVLLQPEVSYQCLLQSCPARLEGLIRDKQKEIDATLAAKRLQTVRRSERGARQPWILTPSTAASAQERYQT